MEILKAGRVAPTAKNLQEQKIYVVQSKEYLDKIDLISLKEALSNLKKEDQKLIYQRYYEGKTQTEIAKENNISQVKVYRLERKILDDLSDKLCA